MCEKLEKSQGTVTDVAIIVGLHTLTHGCDAFVDEDGIQGQYIVVVNILLILIFDCQIAMRRQMGWIGQLKEVS